MRVAFDSRAAADRGGIGRYVRSLLPALRRVDLDPTPEASSCARACGCGYGPWPSSGRCG